jgi:hypothetical protein
MIYERGNAQILQVIGELTVQLNELMALTPTARQAFGKQTRQQLATAWTKLHEGELRMLRSSHHALFDSDEQIKPAKRTRFVELMQGECVRGTDALSVIFSECLDRLCQSDIELWKAACDNLRTQIEKNQKLLETRVLIVRS